MRATSWARYDGMGKCLATHPQMPVFGSTQRGYIRGRKVHLRRRDFEPLTLCNMRVARMIGKASHHARGEACKSCWGVAKKLKGVSAA